jgi:aminopeptidase N
MGCPVSKAQDAKGLIEAVKFFTEKEEDPVFADAKVEAYAAAVGMDDRNKAAMKVLITKGPDAFVRHVHTGDNGEQLSYAEMRSIYG